MIRVVVADDQDIVRDGLVALLGLVDGIEVVDQAADGESVVRAVAQHRPDVVLMDLRMPGRDGVWATNQLRRGYPETAVLILTTFDDDQSIADALQAGAVGYLTKDAGRAQLEAAIRSVAAGQTTLSTGVQQRLVSAFTAGEERAQRAAVVDIRARYPELTAREAEVAALIASGWSNTEIAAELVVSMATVKSHINALFSKLQVASRGEAVRRLR